MGVCFLIQHQKEVIMHNDFISIIEKYLQSTMEASNLVPLPIAIVDEELKQFWENCYMK